MLAKLKVMESWGITLGMFPRGFRLAARIYDLKKEGHRIVTHKEPGRVARYVLLKKGKRGT